MMLANLDPLILHSTDLVFTYT